MGGAAHGGGEGVLGKGVKEGRVVEVACRSASVFGPVTHILVVSLSPGPT